MGQCCSVCNATDMGSIQWSSTLSNLQQQVPIALGSNVLQLQLPSGTSGSFRAVMIAGGLAQACTLPGNAAYDAQTVRWQLGTWGTCSNRCEGGHAMRSATCIDGSTGMWAAAEPATGGLAAEQGPSHCVLELYQQPGS